ncbi:hypothetical protein P4H61_24790 [Paenibacillus peoriae]|uniref:hypothetical protein n=1 Tax=Paenibacillus peoriae TaxID=59893 RepID=UPI0011104BA9|nr:hypothetical protein [Paenibacillus peoriae]MEC0184696.1 hypothetical protein [Paenibacillus peoriae]
MKKQQKSGTLFSRPRLRVSIVGAGWPTFEILPGLSPNNDTANPKNVKPTITIYRDKEHPSHILLPIIPE